MNSHDENKENNKSLVLKELSNFSDTLTNYFSVESQDYLNLIIFIEQIASQLNEFSKIKIPNKYDQNKPEDSLNLNSFYIFQKKILDKMKAIPTKIKDEIVSTLNKCKDEFESDNKMIFFSINEIIEELTTEHKLVDEKKKNLMRKKKKIKIMKKVQNMLNIKKKFKN